MKILFLVPGIPHASSHSGFIVVYKRMKMLAERGHEIGLAACVLPEEAASAGMCDLPLIEKEVVILRRRPFWVRLAEGILHSVPPEFRQVWSHEMQATVGRMVDRTKYDVVIAEFSQMGQYLHQNPYLSATRRIISCHTCYTTVAAKAQELQPWGWTRLAMMLSLKRLHRYEFSMYRSADHLLAMTPEEKVDLHHYAPDLRISISPYGVDRESVKPHAASVRENWIVFTGYYGHVANRDAALWFTREVWPAVSRRYPDLSLYIVGRGVTREMTDVAKRHKRVVVTGEVPDVAEYVAKAMVYVCPTRMGKGLRGKILQAMVQGVPVVSTTLGAEGISARSGYDIMLADTSHTMVESIGLLIDDKYFRRFVGRNGRKLALRYTWTHCVDLMEEVLYTVAV